MQFDRVRSSWIVALAFVLSAGKAVASPDRSYTLFESGHVRPLALSPDGQTLYAVNTPDNRLEIFDVRPSGGLEHVGSVVVGLEPVAVAAKSGHEVWVVNHLSDSVSVVDVSNPRRPHVERTLLVGDEPRDIVFAGPGRNRAFITTAHRGQNSPIDPEITTPGVGRADVWVFDTEETDEALTILVLFSSTPRALAVTPDGRKVYAAAFLSGNRTTALHDSLVPDGGEAAGGVPGPNTSFDGTPQPEAGIIVQFATGHWRDVLGRLWDDQVKFSLPDNDVFVIDAMADPPEQIAGPQGFFSGVGTVLYNMAVHPRTGRVYVANTELFNMRRFSGPGTFAGETTRGRFHEDRITILDSNGVRPRHLNKHINFAACCAAVPNAENARSLALPLGMEFTHDGKTLYVAALGSDKVGIFDTRKLEDNTFVPNTADQIHVTGGGPTGLVLGANEKRLYVFTRFDNGISIINTQTRAEVGHVKLFSPEPASVTAGRRFLYDASRGSSHGDSACATCHVFGDFDGLSWDLGNPDGTTIHHPGPFIGLPVLLPTPDFFPMKGPMRTQSLRGLANGGPMHWRGDRTAGNDAPNVQPDSGAFDEVAAFKMFRDTFVDVNGLPAFPEADMTAFTEFMLQNQYPPNPIRKLDNSLTPDQQVGEDLFFNGPRFDLTNKCVECHVIDPTANPDSVVPGFFGTQGFNAFIFEPQVMKVPQLRNLYQKVGMFGMPESAQVVAGDNDHKGDQVSGFGFFHDGSIDSTFRFHSFIGFAQGPFNPTGFPPGPAGELMKRQLEQYVMVFPNSQAPIVGQQVTYRSASANARLDLLEARAGVGECDLVAKGEVGGASTGFLYLGGGRYATDRAWLPPLSSAFVRLLAFLGGGLTFTCVPNGSGRRIGLDRDRDGHLDGDELDHGTDPADATSG
jgi:YVTN family beta-propeller protein